MASQEAIESVLEQIKKAKRFIDIFGPLIPGGTPGDQIDHVKHEYKKLVRIVHPDAAVESVRTFATSVLQQINECWSNAQDAIRNNTYDEIIHHINRDNTFVLRSSEAEYHLEANPYRIGDFSSLYKGIRKTDTVSMASQCVLVKIGSEPAWNTLLECEARILKRFGADDGPLAGMKSFVPELLDTFLVVDENKRRVRAIAMPFAEGFVSLTEVIHAYPKGLDPRDAAWIFRRILAQTLAASRAEVVHGAIVPDHVLVHPVTHEPLHIG